MQKLANTPDCENSRAPADGWTVHRTAPFPPTRRKYAPPVGIPLDDTEVELLRRLWDTGQWTRRMLAAKFEISPHTVRSIVTYRRRGCAATPAVRSAQKALARRLMRLTTPYSRKP